MYFNPKPSNISGNKSVIIRVVITPKANPIEKSIILSFLLINNEIPAPKRINIPNKTVVNKPIW